MLKTSVSVPAQDISKAMRELRSIDQGMAKQLRRDIKSVMKPYGDELAGELPSSPPLSGMAHKGRSRYNGARASVRFAPGRFNASERQFKPLISISLTGRGTSVGFDIAEMAGSAGLRNSVSRTRSFTRGGVEMTRRHSRSQGKKFVKALQNQAPFKFKGGRFLYGEFLKRRKPIQKDAVKILNSFAKSFNRRVR